MRRFINVLGAWSMVVALVAGGSATVTPSQPGFQRVIVQLAPDGPPARGLMNQTIGRHGGEPGYVYTTAVHGFSAELPAAAVEALTRNPNVILVTPDREVSIAAQETPTGFDRIEADLVPRGDVATDTDGCPAATTCTDVDIAVLDTGTNDHEDLRVVQRTDCSVVFPPIISSCFDGQGADGHGHGTHVAGTAAAHDNGVGVVGVAPGARIHSVKVLGDDGTGNLAGIIAGVDWVAARASTIDVVNMSLAGVFSNTTFDDAISNTVALGVTFAVAAGNDGVDAAPYSPANHPDVITVSAVADADGGAGALSGFRCRNDLLDDQLAWFSNRGPLVEIAAPGGCILSTWGDGGYHTISGTSMASPQVAGAAALYVAKHGRDANGDTSVDGADPAFIRSTLVAEGHPQASPCGFSGDTDGFAEPLLFVNGPAFGGDGTCEVEPVDPTAPSAPAALQAVADGFTVQLDWDESSEPESGLLHYRVIRDSVQVATVAYDQTTYLDRDTSPGTTYTYEVDAVNLQNGVSPISNAAPATTSSDDPADAGSWALDEGSGTVAGDSSAWRRDATLVGGPAWTSGKIGAGLDLDGADDLIDFDPGVVDGATDASVSMWIRTTKTFEQALVSGANATNDNEFLLLLANDTLLRYYIGLDAVSGVQWSMASVADGAWHHISLVRDEAANSVTAYRDGVSLGTLFLGPDMVELEVERLVVGRELDSVDGDYQAAQSIDGSVDDVRLFTRVLTPAEIDTLALRDLSPPTAPAALTANPVTGAVDLTWTPADDPESGVEAYVVRRDDGAGGPLAVVTEVSGATTSWRDPSARPGATHVYEVTARNGGGLEGPPSPTESVVAGAVDPSLVGWWAFDDGAGGTAADWSPAARPGTLFGDPVWATGRFGGGLTDDETDGVTLDHTVMDGLDEMSVSLWFQTTKTGVQAFLTGATTANQAEYTLASVNDTDIRFWTGVNNEQHVWWIVPSIADGEWHHLVAVRDPAGDQVILYLDGVSYGPKGTQPGELQPIEVEPNGLIIGQEQDSLGGGFAADQAFVGTMDEVRVYDRALTAAEVADLAGLGVASADTEAPAAPTALVATPGIGQIVLDWDDNTEPDLDSYRVKRSTAAGGPYTEIASPAASGHVDASVVAGQTYFYVVTAVDGTGNESTQTAEVSAAAIPPEVTAQATDPDAAESGLDPGSVTLTRTGPTTSALDVSISSTGDAAAGVDYVDPGTVVSIPAGSASVVVDIVPLDDGVDEPAETVTVVVGAGAGYAVGTPGQATVTITDDDAPLAPTGLVATAGFGQVGLDWDDSTDLDLASYTVHRAAASGGPYTPIATGLVASDHVDTTATAGQTHFYVVTAVDGNGDESVPSAEASASSSAPEVTATATDADASETGPDPGVITLTRTGPTTDPLVVGIGVGGDATAGDDYLSLPASVTIPAGSASATVDVVPLDDSVDEPAETVVVTVVPDAAYVVGTPDQATVTIADDDEPPLVVDIPPSSETTVSGSIASGDLTALATEDGVTEVLAEHHNGGKKADRVSSLDHQWTFQVGSPDQATVVHAATRADNPDGDDFRLEYSVNGSAFQAFVVVDAATPGAPQEVALPAGTSGTVVIRAVDTDRTTGNASLDTLAVDMLVIRTTNGGGPVLPVVTVEASDPDAAEPADTGAFLFTRSDSAGALVVDIAVSGSATQGVDHVALPSQVTFADGSTTASLTVDPIDDPDVEGTEDVVVTVSAGAGWMVGAPDTATVTIADDDGPATVDAYAVSETTTHGSATAGLGGTTASDGLYEALTEESWAGGKRSRLEHTWTFDLPGGAPMELHVEGYHSSDSDDFVLAWSTDGATWTDVTVVSGTVDPGTDQVAVLPAGLSGTVFVRVVDTDRSRTDGVVSTLWIDHLFIRTG